MNLRQPTHLSACLIVKNEERRLPESLESVAFCDEIIVVDSGSTDRTVEIARAAGARVLKRPWRGFATQRNIALDAADGEWALEVDADERVTPRLREEILALVNDAPPGVDNAMIPWRQIFLGARLGPSALYPACRVRLFRRECYRHDDRRTVHEGLVAAGRSAYLSGDLEHILAESLRESLDDLCSYTRLESMQLPKMSRARIVVVGVVVRPVVKFVYRVLLLRGWQDGFEGITKILLDCLYDSLTWVRYQFLGPRARRMAHFQNANDATDDGRTDQLRHFGRASHHYGGPVRIVAIARGARESVAAHEWLEAAVCDGADVVLITDAPPCPARVRAVHLEGAGPLAVLRAIAWEEQRNPIEILLVPGRGGRAASRLLPGHLRGNLTPVSLRTEPGELIDAALTRRQTARR